MSRVWSSIDVSKKCLKSLTLRERKMQKKCRIYLYFTFISCIIIEMEIVRLNRTSRLLGGHLWVFSNELSESPKGIEPGAIVELRDRKDAFMGIGYLNPHSLIAVRILTRQREPIDEDFFRGRILDALRYRKRFTNGEGSFRVLFSEGDFLPGLIVDKYDGCLSVQVLTAGMEKLFPIVMPIFEEMFSPSVIVLKNDSRSRILEGLNREKKVLKGNLDELPIIREGAVSFAIDPLAGQKTGFFLDQKENRVTFADLAREGEGLDLFCYSGAWSLHLARRGVRMTGVDESGSAISQARKNAEMNDLSGSCDFVQADVFDFLRSRAEGQARYDFVVADPPAFVKSAGKIKEAVRAYREINSDAMRLLKRGGLLATSSCSYHLSKDLFIEMLRAAAKDAGRQIRIIEMRSQARDHPVLLSMPETEYLKCAFLEVE
jgi:23S rRNA (cytosine1962-C5)-methyltransferase